MDRDRLAAELVALHETIEALRERVAHLERSLDLKHSQRCRCGGTVVLQFRRIPDVGETSVHDLALVQRVRWTGTVRSTAPLEAWVCRACGLVEWRATNLDDIVADGEAVVEHRAPIEADAPIGPYR